MEDREILHHPLVSSKTDSFGYSLLLTQTMRSCACAAALKGWPLIVLPTLREQYQLHFWRNTECNHDECLLVDRTKKYILVF